MGSTFRQNTWSRETNRPFIPLSKLSRRISGSTHPRLQYHKASWKKIKPTHTYAHAQQEQKLQDAVKHQQKRCLVCNFPSSCTAGLSQGEQQRIQDTGVLATKSFTQEKPRVKRPIQHEPCQYQQQTEPLRLCLRV